MSNGQDVLKFIIFDGTGIDKLVGEDYPILTDNHTLVEFAELNRLGIAGTMPFILARLLPAIRPAALAEQYGLAPQVTLARVLFMRAKAVRLDDPLERSYQALHEVDQASQLAPNDGDITYYKQITMLEFLDLLNARYTELLNSSSPQTLLPKAAFAVQLQPQNHFAQELLGVTLLKLKKYEDAVGPLEAAVSLKDNDITYLSNLAFAYDQVGRSADALRVLKQAKTLKQIHTLAQDIAHKFHPQKIVLFGSYAYGTPTRDSDVDLLVIMRTQLRPVDQAAAIRRAVDAPFPMDLLVRTPEQLERRLHLGDSFVRDILSRGTVLYEADRTRMDQQS